MANRILLVDDHATVRQLLRRVLESHSGLEVCGEAENGSDAIYRAQELRPDLIVLDLSMPIMNGFEAARVLRTVMPKVPILMYTSFTNANLAQEAMSAGVSTVVDKSEPVESLVGRLQELLKPAA